jgi:hypothetical protein
MTHQKLLPFRVQEIHKPDVEISREKIRLVSELSDLVKIRHEIDLQIGCCENGINLIEVWPARYFAINTNDF